MKRLFQATVTAVVVLGLTVGATSVLATGWVRKTTGEEWTWFEDYVYAWASYMVACEPGRSCQVGMGVFAFGEPRGEKLSFSGTKEILTIGIGALYIRAADGKGPVKAGIAPKQAGLIEIRWNF